MFGSDLLVERGATFGWNGKLRFTLTRKWGRGGRICFIGHNGSKGSHLIDDPTVHRWMMFGERWGYGSFVAVNLYPFVSADPKECRAWADWEANGPDWYARDAIMENVGIVAREAKASDLVVACWGALATDNFFVEHVVEEITSGVAPWPDVHVFGLTKGGQPIHPMARGQHRVRDDAKPTLWRQGAKSGISALL